MNLKVGDIVSRRSYGGDILFKIIEINRSSQTALLKGIHVRLLADSPLEDLYTPERKNILQLDVSQRRATLV